MSDQSLVDTHPDIRVEHAHLVPFISNCYRSSLQKLTQSYRDGKPAAILVSEGRFGPSHVIDNFLTGMDDDVTVARVTGSCNNSTAVMREIVSAIGFEPNDMSLTDLENVLEMFLGYQRTHKLRTVICVEDADVHGWWVLDKVRRLVEKEAEQKFGLLVILSGPPSMISILNEPILDTITEQAGERIVLAPFTLSETRDFVRQRVETNGDDMVSDVGDVGEVFEFYAVTLIHEFCAGVPDQVDAICSKSLELIDGTGEKKVSTDTVKTAARLIGIEPTGSHAEPEIPVLTPGDEATKPGCLIAKTPGEPDIEVTLDQNCILIGRDRLCGICVNGLKISRYHALIAMSTHGLQLVDLGSTNGTLVNGHRVKRCTLQDADEITIGRTKITYQAGGEQLAWADDDDRTGSFEMVDEIEPPINFVGSEAQLIRTS